MLEVGNIVIRINKRHQLGYELGDRAEIVMVDPINEEVLLYKVRLLTGRYAGRTGYWDARYTSLFEDSVTWEV
jgi:hypothetical protein